ncbi:hypothetical protein [Enterobacter cancerogenus]|jgi:hypothetical protein|uniref:hypothetical protein n=1 Tax=Enterobacter cancerogenus TaxID=69218 RepID=UPI000B07473C|nr:hypothetical protein [Enterobacter cancerogenus]
MGSPGPTLSITYDQLLETTRTVLHTFAAAGCTPPDEFDRGLCVGAIDLFLTLIQGMEETDRDYADDHRQLRLLAGLETDGREPAADVH